MWTGWNKAEEVWGVANSLAVVDAKLPISSQKRLVLYYPYVACSSKQGRKESWQ